jgi:hypothetical protein
MNKIAISLLVLAACGYSAKNNELIGQVKKVVDQTPIVCPDYVEVDVSLGVIRNGVGSMSREDIKLLVEDQAQVALLKKAAASGQLVSLTYDRARLTICVPEDVVRGVEVEK